MRVAVRSENRGREESQGRLMLMPGYMVLQPAMANSSADGLRVAVRWENRGREESQARLMMVLGYMVLVPAFATSSV
jgi:hypothetical protein